MVKRSVTSQLLGAQIWERAPAEPGSPPRGQFVAGWEDGDTFCASVCTNDVGLGFCRRCPEPAVARVLARGLPTRVTCPAGVGLLAFPAPRGSRDQVAVLRVSAPTPRVAAAIASDVRVAPTTLRRAARRADEPDPASTRAASRVLRSEEGLRRWRVQQREAAADRRRTTTAALAQMIVTGEEYYSLYQASQRHLSELRRNRRQLDDLAQAAFREQDRERARLAHQIHDTAVQSMVSAFRYVEAAALTARSEAARGGTNGTGAAAREHAGAVAMADGPALAALDAATERMAVAIGELRSILAHLMPPGLEELGLASAIERRLEWLAVEGDLEAEMHGGLPRLEPWVEQALYGMAAEAITNAVRHGHPRRVAVTLRTLRARAIVEVRDDGAGFDRAGAGRGAARAGSGLGLLGIERQAQWLGGRAIVDSRPGHGTRVRISVPLERHRRSGQEGAVPETRTEEAT